MSADAGHLQVAHLSIGFEGRRPYPWQRPAAAVQALDDVSLEVAPGEFVAVIGPSGCGKSSLLNAVAGFQRPASGAITIDGRPVIGPGADRGVVFQQYSLFPWMSVRANVEYGLKRRGMPRAQRRERARELLAMAGLSSIETMFPEQLSGGMRQRVGIVRALATSPRILLMDEPFGALDAQTRTIMQELLTSMWRSLRLSVLLITHDIDEAIFLSDRIYVMTARPGRIKEIVPVPLARPRDEATTRSVEFFSIRSRLLALLRDESLKAFDDDAPRATTDAEPSAPAGEPVAYATAPEG
ncbi:ABC transporter ATP-binding protein [Paraburkholderia lycopersici]|uniref:NitT/TauT family transport system ATP-binding protein n=1 Tax=Paraburkholderia lycopersici TaxID=416944 RepID=A0A1G6Q807_9BURK|nr:ABC transporter ATP-binding protein [Paraburkholderia lycopersici]SDC88468.1 NitT/TauT family transport system ATP-binding protein [Paraburkholderia lycopersici]